MNWAIPESMRKCMHLTCAGPGSILNEEMVGRAVVFWQGGQIKGREEQWNRHLKRRK